MTMSIETMRNEAVGLERNRSELDGSEQDIVSPTDLQLSPEGYVKVFQFFLPSSLNYEDAFTKVEQYCAMKGYKPRYNDFESFRQVYYRQIRSRRDHIK